MEERDLSSLVVRQFFNSGETLSGSAFFYAKNHNKSITELTDSTGVIQGQYAYNSYGMLSKLQGAQEADFQYGGYYIHQRSKINLTLTRAYYSMVGRFLNRDPLYEDGGVNLYTYATNNPVQFTDPTGLSINYQDHSNPPTNTMSMGDAAAAAAGAAAAGNAARGAAAAAAAAAAKALNNNKNKTKDKENKGCHNPCPPPEDHPENTSFIKCIQYCWAYCDDRPDGAGEVRGFPIMERCVLACNDQYGEQR